MEKLIDFWFLLQENEPIGQVFQETAEDDRERTEFNDETDVNEIVIDCHVVQEVSAVQL
jgi:hypothetical protein